MIRSLFSILLLFSGYLHAAIDEKITKTQTRIHTKKVQEKEVSKKLDQLAQDILKQSQTLKKLKKEILETEKKILRQKKDLHIKSGKLQEMEKLYKKLKAREEEVNKKLASILSKQIAITMIEEGAEEEGIQNIFEQNSDHIVFREVLQNYSKLLKSKFAKTKIRYEKLQKNRKLIQSQLQKTHKKLTRLQKEQDKLRHLQNLQSKTIQNLRKKEHTYVKKLARIRSEKQKLAKMLNKLSITRKKLEQTRIKPTDTGNIKVRQIGSSYQKGSIAKYKGPKTIAPLKNYTLVQKFGTFMDPVYKIKIFNESIELKPTSYNAVVRNILPGKIVYASKVPMLDFVVIVEHPDKLHTIYAHLSKIAPNIKVGRKVNTNYVIGRVNNSLTFEVTQNEKHINPMELIR